MRFKSFKLLILSILFGLAISCSGGGGSSIRITTSSPLPEAIAEVAYPTPSTSPFTLQAENATAPLTWTFANFQPSKPVGLNFNSNGKIDGAAAKYMDGDYTFDATVTDSSGKKKTQNFAMKIWSKVTFDSPADLPVAMPGPASFQYTLLVTGGSGSYTFSAGSTKPSWITLNTTTGELSGTPPSNATGQQFNFEVTVKCNTIAANFETKTFSLSITPAQITNFKGPAEVFAQQTIDVSFDVKNHGSKAITVTGANFTFSHGGGSTGNVNAQYQAIAYMNNPTIVASGSTETFIYHISTAKTLTKATSTLPIEVELELDFTLNSSPMKTHAPNSISWACRIWETLSDMPTKLFWGAAAEVDGHIYYFGGMDTAGDYKDRIYDYEISSNTWTTLSILIPTKSIWHTVVTVNKKVYIIGGTHNSINHKNIYEFNPAGPSISKIGETVQERLMCSAASNGNDIFIMGSYKEGSIEMFNLATKTSTGKTASASNFGRFLNHAVYYNNKYYTFGGSFIDQYDGYSTVYEYDSSADTLTLKNQLNHAVTAHALAQMGKYVYCIAGVESSTVGATDYVQRYDLDTFTAEDCGIFVDKVFGNRAVAVGDSIYNMGGAQTDETTANNRLRVMEFK